MDNNNEVIETYPLEALKPHPRNKEFFDDADDRAFQNLKDSIAEVGLLTPLRISKNYTIISGHQRYKACKELGVEYVPCIMDDGLTDENEMLMQLIVSNFGRMKNDPGKQGRMIEEYEKMMGVRQGSAGKGTLDGTKFRPNQDDIASKFGITARAMREYKRFAHMPPEIQECVKSGKFSMTAAVRVLDSLSLDEQLKVIASFPEAQEKITRAAMQEKVAELFQNTQEEEQKLKAKYEAKEAANEKMLQAKKDELDKSLADAQSLVRQAEAQSAMAQVNLEKIQKQIAAAQDELDSKREELADLEAQLEQQPVSSYEPEIVYPDDYEEIKSSFNNAQIELLSLRNQLAEIKSQSKRKESVVNLPTRSAHVEVKKEDRGREYMITFQGFFADMRYYIENVIADPDIFRKELSPDCHKTLSEAFVDVIKNLTAIVKILEDEDND